MLSYAELAEIIQSSAAKQKNGIVRPTEMQLLEHLYNPKPLNIITGIRRCGKSFLLKRLYAKLVADGIPRQNLLFLNFEDDRLYPHLDLVSLRFLYELFLVQTEAEKPVYLFLDEIQNIPAWEKFVRTVYDSTQHHIYITGSNSYLLSGELATALGGRILEFKLLPFTFAELLQLNEVSFANAFDRAENKQQIARLWEQYFHFGGLPEVCSLHENARIDYRKSLVDKIILKDIIARQRLQSPELLNRLYLYLERNTGNDVSYRKIAQHTGSTDQTIESYLALLELGFIINRVNKFSWKTRSIFESHKKFYFTDNLLCHYADIEDKLENACYLHLLSRYGKDVIFTGRDERDKEIDFVVKLPNGSFLAIQVCLELTDQNLKRETSSLLLFDKYLHQNNTHYYIVVQKNSAKEPIPELIQVVSIIDFLLELNFLNL